MTKGIFITGTDTGVGKTFIACGLIRSFKSKGINVCPMKPAETGCRKSRGRLIPGDTLKLIKASEVDEAVDTINPYRFRHPLAPSVAAEIDNISINPRKIYSSYKTLSDKYDMVIIEGAGGIMVPLYKKYLFADLVKALSIPCIVVARPGLGTINHTLLTLETAKKRGIDILGVIMNHPVKTVKDLAEKTNPGVIEKLSGVPILGEVPFFEYKDNTALRRTFNNILSRLISLIQ